MVLDSNEQVLLDLLSKDYVIFAPKGNKELKREYKELDDYQEFKALNNSDLLFVWWYACKCSPLINIPEEKRVFMAIDQSYRDKGIQEARKVDWQNRDFPPHIKQAIKVMDRFNPQMRVQFAADTQFLLQQCQHAIRQDTSKATPEEKEDYMKTAILARKLQKDILQDLERGNSGVAEVQDTSLKHLEGISGTYMKSKL